MGSSFVKRKKYMRKNDYNTEIIPYRQNNYQWVFIEVYIGIT